MSALRKPIAEPEPDPRKDDPRKELAAAIARVKEAEDALEASRREQQAVRAKIHLMQDEIARDEAEMAATPALERKPLRAALAAKREDLGDLQQHLVELQKKEGGGDPAPAGSFSSRLQQARHGVHKARGELLRSSASVQALFARCIEGRNLFIHWHETLKALAAAGALPPDKAARWDILPAEIQRVDPAWRAALDALRTDPNAELP